MPVVDVSVVRAGSLQVTTAWSRRIGKWWLSGLRDAVPRRWLDWADSEAMPVVVIRRDGDTVICRFAFETNPIEARFSAGRFGVSDLNTWIAEQGWTREQVVVQSVLSRDLFFLREMSVPRPALRALPGILEQELRRRMPFEPSDVWHSGIAGNESGGELVPICHWIVRKDRAETALAELGLTSNDVDRLAVESASGDASPAAVITLRPGPDEDPIWALRAIRLLAAAGLVTVVLALLVFEWNQANVAAQVEAALAEARQGAQSGRDAIDPTARLFAMKADVGILGILDELSRILPDHTFLTDARIADGKVTISGYSADAARLVRTIDQSPMFTGAALAAAITPDANERKERFSIAFKVRGARPSKAPATARSSS